jgi:glucose-1-phosphate cytidylyltransferase
MKLVILAGGLGTRISEETAIRPKPMIEIGGKPILWHIMKNLSVQGINDFCIATGYNGTVLKDYFLNYGSQNVDISLSLRQGSSLVNHGIHDESGWNLTIANTGELTMTGGRIFRALKYLKGERFLCTYGDGVSDVNINKLLDFHKNHGKVATMMVVKQPSRFGVVELDSNLKVNGFGEKPTLDGWVNAGYFVFNKSIFDFFLK